MNAKDIFEAGKGLPEEVREKMKTGAQRDREEGIEEGLEKGLEKGLELGMRQRDLEVAGKMLAKGYQWEEIEGIAGISKAEYQKLKRKAPSSPPRRATPSRRRSGSV